MSDTRYIVGVMTGTSIDGLDVALCKISGRGLDIEVEVMQVHSVDFPVSIATGLRSFADNDTSMTARQIVDLSKDFAMLHATSIRDMIQCGKAEGNEVKEIEQLDLVCVHGQTVYHAPPFQSWQLFTPAPLAHELNVACVCDLRAADIAAGAQGAPLTPLADWILFRDKLNVETRCVVNLGGFCNITLLSPTAPVDTCSTSVSTSSASIGDVLLPTVTLLQISASIQGFDVCACSQLLDCVARLRLNMPYDIDGQCASEGTIDIVTRDALESKLSSQVSAGRSLGTADYPAKWIEAFSHIKPNDLAASAVNAIARVIMAHIPSHVRAVFLAGGGARNMALRRDMDAIALERGQGMLVCDTGDKRAGGVDVAYREAACWAVLGALCEDAIPITLPSTTGVANPPCSGTWVMPPYPKKHPRGPRLAWSP